MYLYGLKNGFKFSHSINFGVWIFANLRGDQVKVINTNPGLQKAFSTGGPGDFLLLGSKLA